jgi:7,8-dihydropterin-6-yl-methyl-4-(beta-D-ribofuranosyl)aminobenzene 5'-phosphate synthase
MSAVSGDDFAVLDSLEMVVVVDNETDTLSSIDPGVDQVSEISSLVDRVPPTRHHDGHPGVGVFEHLCVACHGFSVLLRGRRGDEVRSVLFDVGPYGEVWLDNAVRLRIELASIEVIFLSHWHGDHSGAFPVVVEAIATARSKAGLEPPLIDLHPDRPDQRGVLLPSGTIALLPPEPTFDQIREAGGRIVLNSEPHPVARFFVGSGQIERVTEYETGLVGHHTFRGGRCELDPLILDERLLAAYVRGRGVSVLSACSHAGVVNACLTARELSSGLPVDVVLGGYHLAGSAMEQRIHDTVRDLVKIIAPRVVAPGHCTGWRAKAALAAAFAPGRYGPSVVGSRYVLDAQN